MKPPTSLLLLVLPGMGLAQGAPPLMVSLTQAVVRTVTENGKVTEQRLPLPGSVRPGDVLVQAVTARNTSGHALVNVALKLPVPASTVYLAPDGALPQGVRPEYSIDGGKTFAPAPLKRTVTVTENGRSVTREVEVRPNEYQAVRWTIATLPAGAEQKLGFRVQVR
ncbi:hypothetical protein DEIPH_ctg055orf0024 [Deinococcus phoenicis]|uniref:DUF11 domain-containing protein n=1 Tax=Deinococcus phoenicis TaxID=1476583 RepID=A0A016QM90_9DEIO|nr:hypothetical protein [Deinococcus phoenicis]EYB66992.1 hypothetical protein DEIPH_ctg055orf0024 [Deinococcus phoenicis]